MNASCVCRRTIASSLLMLALVTLALPDLKAQELRPQERAGESDKDLAQSLSNPLADMVSIPFQFNWLNRTGPRKELVNVVNIQPVVPFSLTENWNLIGRLIVPYLSMPSSFGGSSGTGDMIVSGFFSPKKSRHLVWGAGPVVTLPTTTNPTLGSGKWSAGPTIALLKQSGSMTYGFLGNQLWSYAGTGEQERTEVNQAYFQPMIAHASHSGVTLTLTSETIANWKAKSGDKWTVPAIGMISKIHRLGPFPVSMGIGGGYYVTKPDGSPAWLLRTAFTIILPKGR